MISRVGAALSQLIKPIASSTSQDGTRPTRPFERFQPKENPQRDKQPNSGSAQVIPFPKPESEAKAIPTPTAPPTPASNSSVAYSFILLLSHFQQRRTQLFRWFGHRAYQRAASGQKRLGNYQKGAMLDRKIE